MHRRGFILRYKICLELEGIYDLVLSNQISFSLISGHLIKSEFLIRICNILIKFYPIFLLIFTNSLEYIVSM
jgi:hypothetical protein